MAATFQVGDLVSFDDWQFTAEIAEIGGDQALLRILGLTYSRPPCPAHKKKEFLFRAQDGCESCVALQRPYWFAISRLRIAGRRRSS